uniref:Uncharacterized protein n=2 Tax=Micrurus lemniscatus lemniscatus TaxID=129467 RepID=A0A2D4I4H4_MICLE
MANLCSVCRKWHAEPCLQLWPIALLDSGASAEEIRTLASQCAHVHWPAHLRVHGSRGNQKLVFTHACALETGRPDGQRGCMPQEANLPVSPAPVGVHQGAALLVSSAHVSAPSVRRLATTDI